VFSPQAECDPDVARIADFFQGEHVRPERINETVLALGQLAAQGEPGLDQQVFSVGVGRAPVFARIPVVAEHVQRHAPDIQFRGGIDLRPPVVFERESGFLHQALGAFEAFRRASHGEQRILLVRRELSIQILHHHREPGIIVAFLHGGHHLHDRCGGNRLFGFDSGDPAHSPPSSRRMLVFGCFDAFFFNQFRLGPRKGRPDGRPFRPLPRLGGRLPRTKAFFAFRRSRAEGVGPKSTRMGNCICGTLTRS
jgi:hypothetical protein